MADRHTTEKLLEGERLSGKVTLFAKVTILPGDELPYHEHHGETEVYHILSGEGIYQDNNKTYPVQAGTLMRQLLHLCSSVNSPHPYSNCYQEYTCYAAH